MSNETSLGSSTTHEDIVDTLSFFDDWEERYTYIIELGKALPPYPEALKIESHLVRGCQSQVWLHIEVNDDGTLSLYVDSDALIVRERVPSSFTSMCNHTWHPLPLRG